MNEKMDPSSTSEPNVSGSNFSQSAQGARPSRILSTNGPAPTDELVKDETDVSPQPKGPEMSDTEDTDDSEQSEIGSRPQKKRWMILLSLIVLLGLLAGGMYFGIAAVQERNEARAEVVQLFDDAVVEQADALATLQRSVEAAEATLGSVEKNEVTDAQTLTNLSRQLEFAKETLASTEDPASDVVGLDNQQVKALAVRVASDTHGIEVVNDALDSHVAQVKESVAAKQQEEEEARLAAEEERQAAELAQEKASAQPISYEDLFRAGDTLAGQFFTFQGKVIQTIESSEDSAIFRVNITADQGYSRVLWEDTVMLYVVGATSQKLLEDDIIAFTASSAGLTSYTSIMGATIELPALVAEGADVAVTGRAD